MASTVALAPNGTTLNAAGSPQGPQSPGGRTAKSGSSASVSASASLTHSQKGPIGGPASATLGSSHLELSEKWSRKVLDSLRSLNESLAHVRQSVTRIDSVAQQKLHAHTHTHSHTHTVKGAALAAAFPPPVPGAPAGPAASAEQAPSATTNPPGHGSGPAPPGPFSSALAEIAHTHTHKSAGRSQEGVSSESLKALLLAPSLAGCGLDPRILDEVGRYLDADTVAAVRAHVARRPDAGTGTHTPRSRPHTPPPVAWHSPGRRAPGSAGAAEDLLHSSRVSHSTLDAEVQTEGDARGRAVGAKPKKHAHFASVAKGADGPGSASPSAAGNARMSPHGTLTQSPTSFAGDSSDEDATRPARPSGGVRFTPAPTDEDASEERALVEAMAHKDGKIKRNASGDAVGTLAVDYDSDDDEASSGAATPAIEADIAAVQARLQAGLPQEGSAPREAPKAVRHGSDASTAASSKGVANPREALHVPPAPQASATQRQVFKFTRYVEEGDPAAYDDDGTAEDIPVSMSEIPESEFFAMEEEAAELRRMKAQLQALRAEREAEKSKEGKAGASSGSDSGATGGALALTFADAADPYTVVDEAEAPRVVDWFGGDAEWPSAPLAAAGDVDADAEGDLEHEGGSTSARDAADVTSAPSRSSRAHAKRFEAFALRIVYEAGRTGFEDVKEFNPPIGTIIAGRYAVRDYLGSAAFSAALACDDLTTGDPVCLKVIKNNKDFFDQSLDEIKLLRYINAQGDADAHHVLRLLDYFYHKEHLILVTELLKDNLYEFQKYLRDNGEPPYFTIPRIQRITKHVLEALAFIHGKGLVHCDLKPENILIKSYSRCEVKVIDFGSSCFITDHLSSYIQSRSYRAPEVVLGLPYGTKIDVWSLGCIICELLTGFVLFPNDSVQTMLGRIQSLLGPFPQHMIDNGRDVHKYFSAKQVVYERMNDGTVTLYHPRKTNLRLRLQTDDQDFLDFVAALLTVDPEARPTAAQALRHPWMRKQYELEPYTMPT